MSACFAPGCTTGYKSTVKKNKALGKRNPSLFSAPKDIELLQEWRKAIPRKDRVFKDPYKICELHFEEDCILRTFQTKITDGSVFVYERERQTLKPGSVPTKFPNCSEYFKKKLKRRKASSQNETIETSVNENCPQIYSKKSTKDPLPDLQLDTPIYKTYSRRKTNEDLLLDHHSATPQNETYCTKNPTEDLLPDPQLDPPEHQTYSTKKLTGDLLRDSQSTTLQNETYCQKNPIELPDPQLPTPQIKTDSKEKSAEDLLLDPQATTAQNETYSWKDPTKFILPDPNQYQVKVECLEIDSLDLSLIVKPNKYWSICKNDDGCILCIKLDADFHYKCHVVIGQDCSVKVFLLNKEILENKDIVQSEQDLSLLLKNVDELSI